MSKHLRLYRFPVTDYETAVDWQRRTASEVRDGAHDALALLQHAPVYTFGRRVRPEHLLLDAETLRRRGAEVVESDRGGDVTFHGPGQLVGYPILNLRRDDISPVTYVRMLEDVLITTLQRFEVEAARSPGRPGVWVDGAKIAAIGVRIQGGVTTHGFALNVDPDLSWFDAIVPCGLGDAGVTSMERCLGHSPGVDAVTNVVAKEFAERFDYELSDVGATFTVANGLRHDEQREPLTVG